MCQGYLKLRLEHFCPFALLLLHPQTPTSYITPHCRSGFIEPTWEELYGEDMEVKPFDEFFSRDPDSEYDYAVVSSSFFPGLNKPQLINS